MSWANWPLKCILHSTLGLIFLKCSSQSCRPLIESHCWFPMPSWTLFKLPWVWILLWEGVARSGFLCWGRDGRGAALSWAWSLPMMVRPLPARPPFASAKAFASVPAHLVLSSWGCTLGGSGFPLDLFWFAGLGTGLRSGIKCKW